jgi:hypothetical protein
MKGETWSNKICNVEDASSARSLSKNATVSCSRCGAKAHDPASVCDPVALGD